MRVRVNYGMSIVHNITYAVFERCPSVRVEVLIYFTSPTCHIIHSAPLCLLLCITIYKKYIFY